MNWLKPDWSFQGSPRLTLKRRHLLATKDPGPSGEQDGEAMDTSMTPLSDQPPTPNLDNKENQPKTPPLGQQAKGRETITMEGKPKGTRVCKGFSDSPHPKRPRCCRGTRRVENCKGEEREVSQRGGPEKWKGKEKKQGNQGNQSQTKGWFL